jgi:hypothetical protein
MLISKGFYRPLQREPLKSYDRPHKPTKIHRIYIIREQAENPDMRGTVHGKMHLLPGSRQVMSIGKEAVSSAFFQLRQHEKCRQGLMDHTLLSGFEELIRLSCHSPARLLLMFYILSPKRIGHTQANYIHLRET